MNACKILSSLKQYCIYVSKHFVLYSDAICFFIL